MRNLCEIAIVLPIYNPHHEWDERFENSLRQIDKLFQHIPYEVILVDDGSTNENLKEWENHLSFPHFKFIRYSENKGKGHAIRTGIKAAEATYYIYTDWDFPFGEKIVFKAYQELKEKNIDLIIGTRGRAYYKSLPLFRRMISSTLRFVNFTFFNFKKIDSQAGFKALNNKSKEILLKTKTNSFVFEIEFIKECLKNKLSIAPINVDIKKDIIFTNFSNKTIINELKAALKLLFS